MNHQQQREQQALIRGCQNLEMVAALDCANIPFTKLCAGDITQLDLDFKYNLLKVYNQYLRQICKKHSITALSSVNLEEEEEAEEEDEVVVADAAITNMYPIKCAFFNKEGGGYGTFRELVAQHPFKFFKANYRYASDNTGRPAFIAKNLLQMFAQSLDEHRKYLMVCFRCICVDKAAARYAYPSYWIVNTRDGDLMTLLGGDSSLYGDFEFIAVTGEEAVGRLLTRMQKNDDENDDALVGEVYVH